MNYKKEFENLYKDKKYNEARSVLQTLRVYIEDNKKLANKRKIDEVYEENSLQAPSLREPKYINGILIVNKEYGLPDTYSPGEDPEAREAFERMKADATKEGIYLNAFSTYRSYYTQETLYNNYVYTYGQSSTDTFSARPGFSEHQTGLAFDIGGVDRSLWAQEDFKYTKEANWLKENCYKYGFILRYPEGKEWKTGYMHESWHFRYIGVEHSINFANSDLTLEEYLGL
ncbi:M15 family metallopeptidase [Caproiciproducens sp. MSJ-32]|nr:M15 family metallopeptidase [Caproiciproducens sp. MSJ-32]